MAELIVEPLGEVVKDAPDSLREVVASLGRGQGKLRKSWLTRLATAYLQYRDAHKHEHGVSLPGTQQQIAETLVRRACLLTAASGAGSGALTTGAAVASTSLPELSFLVTIPAAALGITIEMVARTLVHLDMTCDIAAVFGLHFNPDDPTELWQLYGLALGAHQHEDEEDPGAELVHRVAQAETHEVSETLAGMLLGESVLKNVIPVLGIATSAFSNWKRTKKLGDTVRRWARYTRALDDALKHDEEVCAQHLDLLFEGLWFIFIADGQLNPEEAAVLASMLRELPPERRPAVQARLVKDESDWLERLRGVPEAIRAPLLHALEVAAAVDKVVSLPEQKVLARAARSLRLDFDVGRVQQMIRAFESAGVLDRDVHGRWLGAAPAR